MQFHLLAALAGFSAVALAQVDTSNLPSCATACVGNSITESGCSNIDASCICANKNLITGLACCVSTKCSKSDQDKTIQFADDICKPFDVNLPQSASCPASSSSGTATGSASSSSGSSSATGSAASASTTGSSSSSRSSSSTTTSTGGSSSGTSGSVSQATGAAAPMATMGVGLGAVLAGMVAAL